MPEFNPYEMHRPFYTTPSGYHLTEVTFHLFFWMKEKYNSGN